MRDQLMGTLISLCVFVLALVWLVDTPAPLRYGVSGLVLLLAVFGVFLRWLWRKRIRRHRNGQLANHSSAGKE